MDGANFLNFHIPLLQRMDKGNNIFKKPQLEDGFEIKRHMKDKWYIFRYSLSYLSIEHSESWELIQNLSIMSHLKKT